MHTDLANETVELLPQRALYWAGRRLLAVADAHFGKAASFRARGVPVPAGTTSDNLAALDALLAAREIERIVFLGDFLHSRAAHAPATLAALRRWRANHPSLELTLVRGNHDRHAGDPPADLGIAVVDEPYHVGPFAFCHHPQSLAGAYVLAGHLHPVYRLAAGGDAARLPCFLFSARHGLLPSFGAFTGGHPVLPAPGDRLFVVADDAVFRIPAPEPPLPARKPFSME
ncbi:MAG: ligase-associated DNA damage response endonuclease PdeM [Burkholderiaceae bacterium]